jgi:hypothetical protein
MTTRPHDHPLGCPALGATALPPPVAADVAAGSAAESANPLLQDTIEAFRLDGLQVAVRPCG